MQSKDFMSKQLYKILSANAGATCSQVRHLSQPINKCNNSSVTRLCFKRAVMSHSNDTAHLLEGIGEGCSKAAWLVIGRLHLLTRWTMLHTALYISSKRWPEIQ